MKANPITLEALTVIDTIERRGSYAKAAEELDKATSALSYIVQKLEEQLDVTLFERQGRRSVLTPAGRLLLDEGRELLASAERLRNRTLEVAHGAEADADCFYSAIYQFLDRHPAMEIELTEHVLAGGWEALENDTTDLLVMVPGPVPRQKGFRAIRISENDMVPVVAANHPLAAIAEDSDRLAREISQHRRVVLRDSSREAVHRTAGIATARASLFVQNMDQKIEAQAAGLGVGHLPQSRIRDRLANGTLVRLNINVDVSPEPMYLAFRTTNKGKGLRALVRLFEESFKGTPP